MKIGIPKEIKNNENRVAMTPAGVVQLVARGHQVYIQSTAGEGSGFCDEDYLLAGATILPSIDQVYKSSQMIMKVKEPIEQEYELIHSHHIIFTYFHFASSEKLTRAMIASGAVCIAYETVESSDRSLPLLIPMSEVAGRMSVQEGAKYLEKTYGGRGMLLGGVPGVQPTKVLIIGGGIVGTEAAKMAAGAGADVTIMDVDLQRLRYLDDILPANVKTMMSNEFNIRDLVKNHHLIIGAVLISGAKAPSLITKDMLKTMQPGTVLVDVAIDQGGCIETSKPTTHDDPIFIVDDVVHYSVANMPGAVPRTSTIALTNSTMKYAIEIAENGWLNACKNNPALKKGLNIIDGSVVCKGVALAFKFDYSDVDSFLI